MTIHLKTGLLTFKSNNSVKETASRLIALFEEKDITLFAHIDHALGASKVDIELRPMEVIIFGNPATGSPLILAQPTIGIDLPQKALIWEDENNEIWLAFNAPTYLAERHDIDRCEQLIENLSTAFAQFAAHCTSN